MSGIETADPTSIPVVIVDDHEVVREGTRRMLERDPDIVVVDEVSSVRDALTSARRLLPRLMVIDVELPDGSGVDVVRAIIAEGLPIRCLMLSAHDDYVYFSEAFAAGAGGYLLKTASAAEFVAAARTVTLGGTVIDGSLSHRLAGRHHQPEDDWIARLTARELDVIAALVQGKSNKEIARDLGIGLRTIESYVSAILAKLGVRSRTEATIFAIEHHLATPRQGK
ncbi:MAG TPA: response regulator transcription factor [Acidimicrobiales bacterium]|nr:response regulator transcription factor [Acidimicrobiales bacterium]